MAALTAALMAMTGANAVSQYANQRRDASYAATIAGQNAGLADQQAADAIARGELGAQRVNLETRGIVGAQRAGTAGGGVDVSTGSPVDVAGSTAAIGALDAQTLRNNAALEAWGYKVEGANYRAQEANARAAGRNAWGTLLTGVTQIAGQYAANRSTSGAAPDPSDADYARWGATMSRVRVQY